MHHRLKRLSGLGFERMAEIVPAGESPDGRIKVKHRVKHDGYGCDFPPWMPVLLDDVAGDASVPPGRYAMLFVDGEIVMSDTPYELESSETFLNNAHGNVLVAGLGLGATLIPVARKPDVRRVMVVEKEEALGDLVWKHLPLDVQKKTEVWFIDAFEWLPPKGVLFDTVWLDIWPAISPEYLPEMTRLRARFKPWYQRGAWVGVWGRRRARLMRKQELALIARHGYSAKEMPLGEDPIKALSKAREERSKPSGSLKGWQA